LPEHGTLSSRQRLAYQQKLDARFAGMYLLKSKEMGARGYRTIPWADMGYRGMMKRLKEYLVRKARNIFRRKKCTGIRVVERVSDVPENTKGLIYIVQREGIQQWAILDCPCRTGPYWATIFNSRFEA
jgi:hypothetical protein